MKQTIEKFKEGLRAAAVAGRDKAFAEIKPQTIVGDPIEELVLAVRELRAAIVGKQEGGAAGAAPGMKLTIIERDTEGRVRAFESEPLPGQAMRFTVTERDAEGRVKSFQSEAL